MKVGDKVWISGGFRGEKEPRQGEITKIGREYIYAKFSEFGGEMKFQKKSKSTLENYPYRLWESLEEFERRFIEEEYRKSISKFFYSFKWELSFEDLETVYNIINK